MPLAHVLVAVDGSAHSDRAVDIGSELAWRFDAELTIIHVVAEPVASVPSQLMTYQRLEHLHFSERDLLEAAASEILDAAEMRARGHGVRRVATSIGFGHAAGTIVAYAGKHLAADDVIVMGRRGLGDMTGLILGSVSHEVSHLADCAVLTVR